MRELFTWLHRFASVTANPIHAEIIAWLGFYRAVTLGVLVYDNPTVHLGGDNEPQPDAVLRLETGGHSRISEDSDIEGALDLWSKLPRAVLPTISAISSGCTAAMAFRNISSGVPNDRQIHWFSLEAAEYHPLMLDSEDIIRTHQFPGLWLVPEALLAIATPEH